MDILRSFSPATNPIHLLSGDQNGFWASSVPGNGFAVRESVRRSQSCPPQPGVTAENTRYFPSGETAAVPQRSNSLPSGARMDVRVVFCKDEVFCCGEKKRKIPDAISRPARNIPSESPTILPRKTPTRWLPVTIGVSTLRDPSSIARSRVVCQPIFGILGEAATNDVVEASRCQGFDAGDRRGLPFENGRSHAQVAFPLKSPVPRHHFVQHRAQRKDVRASVEFF